MDINAVESTYTQIQTGNKSYKNEKASKDKEPQTRKQKTAQRRYMIRSLLTGQLLFHR